MPQLVADNSILPCRTPIVTAAAKEIRPGTRISLNWPLDAQGPLPFFGRQAFHQQLYQKPPRIVNDDVWTFNTQSSSQWDGLRHFGYQEEKLFYNGVGQGEIHGVDAETGERSTVLGIQGLFGHPLPSFFSFLFYSFLSIMLQVI